MQPALTPWPLRVLLGRAEREWESRHRIFDLPAGKTHHADPTADTTVTIGGRSVATRSARRRGRTPNWRRTSWRDGWRAPGSSS